MKILLARLITALTMLPVVFTISMDANATPSYSLDSCIKTSEMVSEQLPMRIDSSTVMKSVICMNEPPDGVRLRYL